MRAILLTIFGFACAGPLHAEDPDRVRPDAKRVSTDDVLVEAPGIFERLRLPALPNLQTFTASDVSSGGLHTSVGFKRAFAPTLDENGWLLVGITGSGVSPAGREVKDVRDPTASLPSVRARLLLGRQTSMDGLYLAGFLGPEFESKAIDPSSPKMSRSYGVRFEAQAFWRPSDAVVASLVVSAGSAAMEIRQRSRIGRKTFGPVVMGPEWVMSTSGGYRDDRVGLFVSDIPLFRWTFEVSGGSMRDSDGRNGWYGTLTHMRRY